MALRVLVPEAYNPYGASVADNLPPPNTQLMMKTIGSAWVEQATRV